jgi:DNA-binding XRE family transcriptional regulator
MPLGVTAQVDKVPGWWVREARLAAKATQKQLETLTGRDRTTVYRWERDDAKVEWVTWCGILLLLGLPRGWEPTSRSPRRRRVRRVSP